MKKSLFTAISALLIIVIVIFFTSAAYLFNSITKENVFKDKIISDIYEKTGLRVNIGGDVEVLSFPYLKVRVYDVAVEDTENMPGEKLAVIDAIETDFKYLPLFFGKLVARKVLINDVNLSLIRKETGENNFRVMLAFAGLEKGLEKIIPALNSIALLRIYNANIELKDMLVHKKFKFSNLDVRSENIVSIGGHNGFLLRAKGVFEDMNGNLFQKIGITASNNDQNKLIGNFSFDGRVNLDSDNKKYSLNDVKLEGKVSIGSLIKDLYFAVGGGIIEDLSAQTITVDRFFIRLANLLANGDLHVDNLVYAPNLIGKLEISDFNLLEFLTRLNLIFKNGTVLAGAHSVYKTSYLDYLRNLSRNLKNNNKVDNDKHLGKEHDNDTIVDDKKVVVIQYSKGAKSKNISIKLTAQATSKFLKISNLMMKIGDDTSVIGNINYSHFNDKLIIFNLDVDKFDMDDIMSMTDYEISKESPRDGNVFSSLYSKVSSRIGGRDHQELAVSLSSKNGEVRSGATNSVKNKLDYSVLSDVLFAVMSNSIISGDVTIKDLELFGAHFNKLSMEVNGDTKNIVLSPINSSLYKGDFAGALRIKGFSSNAKYQNHPQLKSDFSGNVANVDVASLFCDVVDDGICASGDSKFGGKLAARMKIDGMDLMNFGDFSKFVKGLFGNMNIKIMSGFFGGIDADDQLSKLMNAKDKFLEKVTKNRKSDEINSERDDEHNVTKFNILSGNFTLADGKISSKDILIKTKTTKILGCGNINLIDDNILLNLDIIPQIGGMGIDIPVKVSGDIFDPSIEIETKKLLHDILNKRDIVKTFSEALKRVNKGSNLK